MRFKNANPQPKMEGSVRLPGTVNYYLNVDASKWQTAVPRYGRVVYHGIYPGIDLAYYGTDDAPTGPAVPIVIKFGNRSTQGGVTLAVR